MKAITGGKEHRSIKRKLQARAASFDPGDATDHTSPSMFAVPSQDGNRQSARMPPVRVPPSFPRQMDILRSIPALGFKTQSDVHRACINEGLKVVTRVASDPTLSNMQAIIQSWIAACQAEEDNLSFQQTIDQISQTVNKLAGAGAIEKAQALVRYIMKQNHGMDDEYWRERYKQEIENRFGHLLKGKRVEE